MDIDFDKAGGLVPAIVQDGSTGAVLMLGYMNREAYKQTLETELVTFFSRSRNRIWIKGETSGNHLRLQSIKVDCDGDSLLVRAVPTGPVCHTGADTCWSEDNAATPVAFLTELEDIITRRALASPEESYTRRLLDEGVVKVGQKVGEEAVETVIASLAQSEDRVVDEASDLVYHLLVLLRTRGLTLSDIAHRLKERHQERE